jgi:hypothetical protein
MRECIRFDGHVCHVVMPEYDVYGDGDGGTNTVITCEDVIRWVLDASASFPSSSSYSPPRNDDEAVRRSRILVEWNEGEEYSSSSIRLDPSYRHDPSLLPQQSLTTNTTDYDDSNDIPNLTPFELLAMGSVWRLPYDIANLHTEKSTSSSSSSKTTMNTGIDRFDPKCGNKPTRLDVGHASIAANPGDYFRVHFDPRR